MRNLDKKDGIVEPGSKLYDKVLFLISVVGGCESKGHGLTADEKLMARSLLSLRFVSS